MNRIGTLTLGALLGASLLAGSGCRSQCTQLRSEYEKTTQAQPFTTVQTGDDLPVHFGVSMRDELLNDVVDRAVGAGLAKALTFVEDISLASGQTIGLQTKGEIADLGLFPDKACEQCLRIDGRLGGSVTLKLPVLGAQTVPLKGAFSVVAPVEFGRTDDGLAAVKLDLGKAAELGRSNVDPEITQLPPTWWKLIEAPLSKLMVEAVTRDLPPVTLFTFKGPDLGIEGLEIVPAKIVSDAKRGVVFAGFHTNLAAPEGTGLEAMTDLGKNADLAIGVDQRILGSLTRAMIASGKISQRWTRDGEEDPNGPVHIGVDALKISPAEAGSANPYELDFRAWNLPEEGQCWWADTRATGTVESRPGGAMAVAIDKVELQNSSMPGVFQAVAKWTTSRLFKDGAKVVNKTLDPNMLAFPGGSVEIGASTFVMKGTGAWLQTRATATGSAKAP